MNRQERRRLAKTSPDHGAERVAQGFALYQRGDLVTAERLFREVLREAPAQPDALRLLGEILTDRGAFAESIALLSRLIAAHPTNFAGHYSLANAYRLAGQIEPAIQSYSTALRLNPGFAGAHHGLGLALRRVEREPEALASLQAATRLAPDWAIAWRDAGLALAVLGDIPGAQHALQRAVALSPALGDAQRHLAAIRADTPGPDELSALALLSADARLPMNERIDLLFSQGRLAEKQGAHATAFAHFTEANGLLRAQLHNAGKGFNRARLTQDIDSIIATFTQASFNDLGDESELPVFMVGMPRAGSSLVEQIAASHSQVFGAGEQSTIGAIAGRIGAKPGPAWTRERLAAEAADYLAGLRAKSGDATRIIDKMPDNIFHLGLIAALFPNARVVFCERDLRDVMISCYFQHFAALHGFDTSLADCAFRAGEVARLSDHWRAVLPLRWMDMSYEALLAEPRAQAQRLVAFLGLEWEERCLNFHETRRTVRTASWSQVRQPLYQHAQGRWRHYAGAVTAALAQSPGAVAPARPNSLNISS